MLGLYSGLYWGYTSILGFYWGFIGEPIFSFKAPGLFLNLIPRIRSPPRWAAATSDIRVDGDGRHAEQPGWKFRAQGLGPSVSGLGIALVDILLWVVGSPKRLMMCYG